MPGWPYLFCSSPLRTRRLSWAFFRALDVEVDRRVGAERNQADEDTLLVHVLDAGDPGAVCERHRRSHERLQRKVVP